jgi:hypothetical protein
MVIIPQKNLDIINVSKLPAILQPKEKTAKPATENIKTFL